MDNNHIQLTIDYRFIKELQIKYGQAIYLSGSIQQLGQWNVLKAVKMQCKYAKFWITSVGIPVQFRFQFKYFIAPYNLNQDNIHEIRWIGSNQQLEIPLQMAQKFRKNNSSQLNIMSFNLRYQNPEDKGNYSWNSRRHHCCAVILQHFPDIVGVQEPKNNQIQFILQKIGHLYLYYGKPRDLKSDEHSGIFVRKDKFLVREDGYVWLNQKKSQGKKGFGSRLPRYFTYLVLEPFDPQQKLLMAVNTHLDHQSNLARQEGVKIIAATITQKMDQYQSTLRNAFITGDFNTPDTDPIFNYLQANSQKFLSLRYLLNKQQSDIEETFNGFKSKMVNFIKNIVNINSYIIIDHIFVRSRDYKPIKFQVIRNKDKIISDHYPIIGYFSSIKSQNK